MFTIGIACLPVAAFSQSSTESANIELQQAKIAWLQCVQAVRDQNGRPPSSGIFGPRFEVNASRFQCEQHWDRTRAAIQAVELASGRPASAKQVAHIFDDAKREVAAALAAPGSATFPATNSPQKAGNELTAPPQPGTASCKGSVQNGLKAFQRGAYETALCHWLPKAQAGDAAAQNNMGVLFERGLSTQTPQSDEQAAQWYLLSARQGFVQAMYNLANVQTRLGHADAANSWIATANSVQQQQNQNASALGYALGCAVAGGCIPPTAPIAQLPAGDVQQRYQPPSKPPQCQLSGYLKDINGNPVVECR
ncbi:MAG: sel1 repeat family protein [Sphingomonadales bacterium]|nr:sel1 repeat family protein [Sphingomonadales bacterium]